MEFLLSHFLATFELQSTGEGGRGGAAKPVAQSYNDSVWLEQNFFPR